MAVIGARPAPGITLPWRRSRVRPRTSAPARTRARPGAARRRREMTGVTGLLVAIAATAGLGLFYLSQSSHVAATGYQIQALRDRVAELRAQQEQLTLQISRARSPAVIQEQAQEWLGLVPLSHRAVRFAPTSTESSD